MTDSYTATLLESHENQLPPITYNNDQVVDGEGNIVTPATINSHGLPCDGTVYVDSTDDVCFANVDYTIDGISYYQKIMNVPFQDMNRTKLYFEYFLNHQKLELTSESDPQVGQVVKG